MSEQAVLPEDADCQESDLTAGGMLKQAREAAGLHIAALAVSLKVPVKKLEALEAEQFDQLPDLVFVRALAASVCRSLKIDAGPILEKLPQTHAPRLHQTAAAINTPFRAASDGPGPSLFTNLSKPAVLAVLALLLGALVIIFFPQRDAATNSLIMPPVSSVSGASSPSGESPANLSTLTAVISATAVDTMPTGLTETASLTSTLAVTSVVQSTPTVSSPTLVISASSGATPIQPSVPKDGVVVFTSKGESWVEVVDAKGGIILRRTLQKGEVVGASGTLPLNVVVGRSGETLVTVRGKPYDMGAAKEGVARFVVR